LRVAINPPVDACHCFPSNLPFNSHRPMPIAFATISRSIFSPIHPRSYPFLSNDTCSFSPIFTYLYIALIFPLLSWCFLTMYITISRMSNILPKECLKSVALAGNQAFNCIAGPKVNQNQKRLGNSFNR
jgi:hypothetical protein